MPNNINAIDRHMRFVIFSPMKKLSLGKMCLLLLVFAVYSCSILFSKMASQYNVMSLGYILFFAGVILALALYAVLWQKILSFMQLNTAFLCKSITIVMVMLLSYLFFSEHISIYNVCGTLCIMLGLLVLVWRK